MAAEVAAEAATEAEGTTAAESSFNLTRFGGGATISFCAADAAGFGAGMAAVVPVDDAEEQGEAASALVAAAVGGLGGAAAGTGRSAGATKTRSFSSRASSSFADSRSRASCRALLVATSLAFCSMYASSGSAAAAWASIPARSTERASCARTTSSRLALASASLARSDSSDSATPFPPPPPPPSAPTTGFLAALSAGTTILPRSCFFRSVRSKKSSLSSSSSMSSLSSPPRPPLPPLAAPFLTTPSCSLALSCSRIVSEI